MRDQSCPPLKWQTAGSYAEIRIVIRFEFVEMADILSLDVLHGLASLSWVDKIA